MSLINCKIELKLKRTNHCVLSKAEADSIDVNYDNTIFTIKKKSISSCSNFIIKR